MGTGQHTKGLTREDLERLPTRSLRRGLSHKADLLVYKAGGEEVLVKDYGRKRGLWRDAFGVALTRREARALRALTGIRGVPQFRGRPDRYSVAMALVPGRSVKKNDPELKGNEGFVRALAQVVRDMHSRGVVHLDLRHRSNLMVSEEGRPVVLDFESAMCFSSSSFGGRLAVRLLGQFDWLAVRKWKIRLCPGLFPGVRSEAPRARLARRWKPWRLARRAMDAFLAIVGGPEASKRYAALQSGRRR